ncbi:MAG: thiamine pyrophosphate-dependent dehydrogenase E1 component subunit alpha [bacterium]|nr:thiamine pyrophosphate-dependent dehydrogenase E1 component subunit alpha [bacterium]
MTLPEEKRGGNHGNNDETALFNDSFLKKNTELGAAVLKMWEHMVTARILEIKVKELADKNMLLKRSFFEGRGQEAGQAAVGGLLENKDFLLPYYRGFAVALSKGVPLRAIAAEILGKKTGVCMGKGVSPINFMLPQYGVFPQGGMLGNGFSIAVGMGVAARFFNDDRVVAIFFGDGAASRGTLYSALNLSVLWKLPIIWVCENNQLSVTTPLSRLTARPYFEKARSIGLFSDCVEGDDLFKVFPVAKKMFEKTRHESAPAFLEIKTYRRVPHEAFFMSDTLDNNFLDTANKEQTDPVLSTRKKIIAHNIADEASLSVLEKKAEREVQEALDQARAQKELSKDELLMENSDVNK